MRYTVRKEDAGGSLAAFLSARFPYHTPEEWTRLAAEGAVRLNDAPPEPGRVLAEGDLIQYFPAESAEPVSDLAVTVLYEDRDIILVNKTGDLPAHPAGRYFKNTLWMVLRERLNVPEPSIINRLDRETSGVTLVARNARAALACWRQFAARSVQKKYTVFTEGVFERAEIARGYIAPAAASAIRKKRQFEPSAALQPEPGREAQWAETLFTPVKSLKGFSVLEAIPHTGRTHQIRATLLALGRPVVGDKMYGLDENIFLRLVEDRMTPEDAVKMRLARQALHASELNFLHPADGRPMKVRAPLPADMQALLG
ncbi:MAG: hypothetical protein A2X35_08950 [Elusimicrobia bacterium GWA2_61_42]|nr:MAG: hypothetical protein A2X35_08950 [Elusimicrobia bacterium GWA2_61_42]OGR75711.1 MAG: hypothetical protein A2X38_06895 [Elusimicrobia bacterium GWC2_61_25]